MYENHYASREDIDAAMRLGCGLPMGPLALMDLIGIDTAYEILDTMYKQSRNRLHAPSPVIKQMMTAGLLGRKSGRGFYTYAEAGSAEVVADAATPAAGGAGDGRPAGRTVGVVGSGTMATGIIEVFAKGGYDVLFVARARREGRGRAEALAKSLEKQVQRGRLDRGRARRGARPGHRRRRRSTTWPTATWSSRPSSRSCRSSRRCSPRSTRSPSRAPCSPPPPPACRSSSARRPATAPADVVGHALLQPGAGDEARRGRLHDLDRARRRGHRARGLREAGQARGVAAPTGPASSSTRCCSRTSTTR